MKLKQTWKYHLVLTIIIVVLNYYADYVYGGRTRFIENFEFPTSLLKISFFITFFSIYFINFNWVCPKLLSRKRLGYFIIAVIGLVFLFSGIRFLLEEVIGYQLTGSHNYGESKRVFGYYVFDNLYYALRAILFSTSLYLLLQYIENKTQIHKLEIEHKKAELNVLKTQLEPHFLFNTLNVFYTELVDAQPKVAKNIHKLSEMLRYVTYKAQKDFMPLDEELGFIDDYIHLNRERFEDQLFLNYQVEGLIKDQKIPSLVLIHFVENIFKHGVLNDKQYEAQLKVEIFENHLELHTKNRISKVRSYSSSGIGRENLKKRLSLIYKDTYTLDYGYKDSYFEAHLKLPFINN
ncbi:sensor histidine kinase [Aquimarina sp. 2201CG5-10]|uniref:sensor histidine kinase n=1 Tax=Aquimarina callyspongiae TaxID=3098150 RepID=UPI002AB37173|nr:histidine kinase [Aquimarina sp. 2201CG5-10]MDY8137201.1 histidine kinase [Aquimarina sp. 2201CG5-10]